MSRRSTAQPPGGVLGEEARRRRPLKDERGERPKKLRTVKQCYHGSHKHVCTCLVIAYHTYTCHVLTSISPLDLNTLTLIPMVGYRCLMLFSCSHAWLLRRSCCLVAHAGGEPPDTGRKQLMCPGAPPHSHPSHQSVVQGDGGGSAPCVLVKLLRK